MSVGTAAPPETVTMPKVEADWLWSVARVAEVVTQTFGDHDAAVHALRNVVIRQRPEVSS